MSVQKTQPVNSFTITGKKSAGHFLTGPYTVMSLPSVLMSAKKLMMILRSIKYGEEA